MNIKIVVTLSCGDKRSFIQHYNAARPELHQWTECPEHGEVEIMSWAGVGQ